MTSIKLETNLAEEAVRVRKSRTQAIRVALREIVALKPFKEVMTKHAGRLFDRLNE